MKTCFIFVAFILAALFSAAQGADFITFSNEPMTREERLIKLQVDKHRQIALVIKVQGKCVHGCLKPIDGQEDSIEISQARTGLPEEFLALPVKPKGGEVYYGR